MTFDSNPTIRFFGVRAPQQAAELLAEFGERAVATSPTSVRLLAPAELRPARPATPVKPRILSIE